MKTIKIKEELDSKIAIHTGKASQVAITILEKYNESQQSIIIDFSEIDILISPFVRPLLEKLIDNNVKFEAKNFTKEDLEELYYRVLWEFEKYGTENFRELNT